MNKGKNKGITLIILVIIIVIIIILAVTVILALNKNNPINSAKDASFKAQVVAYKEAALLAKMEVITKNQGDYDTSNDADILAGLGLKGYFARNLFIKDGELVYVPDIQETKKTMLDSIGLNAGCQIPINGKLHKEFDLNGQIVNIAPVPDGFVVSSDTTENTIEQGLVIKQKGNTPNEFVWIPVDNPATDYKRGVSGQVAVSKDFIENDSDPTNIAIKNSVIKYNGFYIARYETGLNVEAKYDVIDADGTYWKDATPVIIRGARPWNYISQTKAIEISKNIVINNASAKSTLINSYMWDTTLNYIISSNVNLEEKLIWNSTDLGNYYNASFLFSDALYSADFNTYEKVTSSTTKSINTPWLLTTGATNRNSMKNIYDLAGNSYEWTTENYNVSSSASFRGGSCYCDGRSNTAASRGNNGVSFIYGTIGLRCVLYLL